MITKDQVKHVAKLANLPLSAGEEEQFSQQLSEIVNYIGQLDKATTKGVDSTFNVSLNSNITQNDTPSTVLTQDESTMNSLATKEGFFITKKIFEDE